MAAGENDAVGFARIAVPKAFPQRLSTGRVIFLINGEHPELTREWADEAKAYFYVSHRGDASELTIGLWFIAVAVAAIALIVSIVVVFISKKKPRRSPADRELRSWQGAQTVLP